MTEEENQNVTVNDFLAQNVKQPEAKEVRFDRFKTPFKIRAINTKELNQLQKDCSTTKRDRRTGQVMKNTDQEMLNNKMVQKALLVPDLTNEELQNSYGTIGDPMGTLNSMLLAGEYADLVQEIQEVSGFESADEMVDDVKK
ncbi:phage tail assembly chaperone [Apilactobacillus timberlakei]|uniref:Phage portal protein n=1 Tax=Apilactobacillus timberlakei TaxID=2008380 RepID=A0ABY2YW30_9LACO|nr:hypothetical protein [Apilactobacillus timberlakei]TPR12399.1 hypothetical protein DY048_07560 [Apilactobacillus timberlakei]TPR12985.1 hypothetical protein DY052_08720 [Apilactobacillus timberlakei]